MSETSSNDSNMQKLLARLEQRRETNRQMYQKRKEQGIKYGIP